MVSADALTIFSGIIILFRNSGKSADFPELPFTGGVITESGSCRAGFLWKHSRGGVNVLPVSTSLSSTTPAHEMGSRNTRRRFWTPKSKNIISLAYAQSNAERIQNRPTQQESAVCFTPSSALKPTRSFTTSPPMIRPATEGTKALEPGTERRWVHLRWVPGGQMQ